MQGYSQNAGIKVTRVSNAVAAGTSAINSAAVNQTGFEAVQFEVLFGAIVSGAVTSIKLQDSPDGSTDWQDLAGTSITVGDGDDNKAFLSEVIKHRSGRPHVRCVVSRATQNSTVDGIVARQSHPALTPVTQATSVGGAVSAVSPETA